MTLETLQAQALDYLEVLKGWLASPQFYAQVIAVVVLWIAAKMIARQLSARVVLLREAPTEGRFLRYQKLLFSCRNLVEPLVFVGLMAGTVAVADQALGASWLIRIVQSLALIRLLHAVIMRFLTNPVINSAARWIGLPIAAIYALGLFRPVHDDTGQHCVPGRQHPDFRVGAFEGGAVWRNPVLVRAHIVQCWSKGYSRPTIG